ncbi:hypothetical protein AciM339_1049 [Aciduliprofundum sp. MAR08-339]|nr:hypothetical protein AciM339_1049 [Aciduliprofundum sp. MAR08-339]
MHAVVHGKIDGKRIDDFVESFDEDLLYLIDVDSHNGGEINFKVYDELSGLFEMWIDAAPRRHYDVMDVLVIGGNKAVITPYFTRWKEITRAIELTENTVLKSYNIEDIGRFLSMGGKEVITSVRMAPLVHANTYVLKGGEICPWRI